MCDRTFVVNVNFSVNYRRRHVLLDINLLHYRTWWFNLTSIKYSAVIQTEKRPDYIVLLVALIAMLQLFPGTYGVSYPSKQTSRYAATAPPLPDRQSLFLKHICYYSHNLKRKYLSGNLLPIVHTEKHFENMENIKQVANAGNPLHCDILLELR